MWGIRSKKNPKYTQGSISPNGPVAYPNSQLSSKRSTAHGRAAISRKAGSMRVRHPPAFVLRSGKSAVAVLFPLTSLISLISLLPEDDVWLILSAIFDG